MSYTKTTWRNNQAPAINADNLNHMEQGIESAHNQIDVNTSNIESLTTQVQNNATNIASEISARQTTDSSLQSQIDQLVAPTGEAPNPAEIENARIGDDGVTYDTLGNAIRTQFSDVKSDLGKIAKPVTLGGAVITVPQYVAEKIIAIDSSDSVNLVGKNILNKELLNYRHIINDSGAIVDDYTSSYYDQFIPVHGKQIKLNFQAQRLYLFDSNKQFLRRTNLVNANTVTSFDSDVYFIKIQIANTNIGDTVCVIYGDGDTTYAPYTNTPKNEEFTAFGDGVESISLTMHLANFVALVPSVGDYPVYEPQTATDDYKCTPLGQNSQSIPNLTNTLKYKGFLETYFDLYLGEYPDGYSVIREDLGLDSGAEAEGNVASSIYSYVFSPKYYNKTVLISAGMNTCEASTYFGLAYFIKELMSHTDDGMEALYKSTRFIVMPVICPSGISHNPLLYTNSNNTRINKNFEYGNSWARFQYQNRGDYPDSEVETKILKQWLNKYRGADFWLDCHSDTANGTERLTLGGGFVSDADTTLKMTLSKPKLYAFYRNKGYFSADETPDLDFTTLNINNAPYPKQLYAKDITDMSSVMFEQFTYTTAYGSDGDTNNDSYGIKHYATMIRHMVLVMCKDGEKWIFS